MEYMFMRGSENMEREKIKNMIKRIRKRKIEFLRPWSFRLKRVGESWRKPKGLDDKHKLQVKGYMPIVKVGYRSPKNIRNIHPSGCIEKIVYRPEELEGLDPKVYAIRIAHTVGRRKRMEIIDKAKQMGLKILNPTIVEEAE
jgi:large subunit ribosomal protein L32e